ncbi:hypothetical protein ASD52_26060 [Ensifer sp. Root142]|uniref:hypothetical protein n=1 Tax=unclassified Ensifer TaxID=2633371 RepID=UPI00070E7E20|nr:MULTISPECIES: hypothetical protein [unclassified Ensifer]KQW71215.1 hypothetical protein ASD03_32805 [Ensifer sp. Root127]KQY73901.1 hypothetical protein ASD52_26060 [Ensifer sp. Root142]
MAESTASIDDDIAGAVEVWTREIKNRDQLAMPHMLELGVGVIVESEAMPVPWKDIERVSLSVWRAFMALIERSSLAQ